MPPPPCWLTRAHIIESVDTSCSVRASLGVAGGGGGCQQLAAAAVQFRCQRSQCDGLQLPPAALLSRAATGPTRHDGQFPRGVEPWRSAMRSIRGAPMPPPRAG
eukprot:COSAG01_NODE_33_length_35013_cov_86.824144_13_plen_104_part_00